MNGNRKHISLGLVYKEGGFEISDERRVAFENSDVRKIFKFYILNVIVSVSVYSILNFIKLELGNKCKFNVQT